MFRLSPSEWDALVLSCRVALCCVGLNFLPGLALAWVLGRWRFPGKTLLNALVHAPLVLPPVVTGYLLLLVFGRHGPLGSWFAENGIHIAFTMRAAVLASALVSFPLMVRALRVSFESLDNRFEDAARSLGAPPLSRFLRVVLPQLWPGVSAGAALTFARSVGEFGATAIFAGNIAGETRTLPLAIYSATQQPGGDAMALRLVLLSAALSVVALLFSEWFEQRLRHQGEARSSTMSPQHDWRLVGALPVQALQSDDLHLEMVYSQPGYRLTARALLPAGRIVGLSAPSGAGKTTLLKLVAGLISPSHGSIRFGSAPLVDVGASIFVAPHRRRIVLISQHDPLFDHYRVRDNLRLAQRWASTSANGARGLDWETIVDTCGLQPLLDRWPRTLSGGERQRVALARALLAQPRWLLLDEPVSALDMPARQALLALLRDIQARLGLSMIYVTHEHDELAALGAVTLRLEQPQAADCGRRITPSEAACSSKL